MRCRSPRKTKTCNKRTRTCNRGRAHSETCQEFFAPPAFGVHARCSSYRPGFSADAQGFAVPLPMALRGVSPALPVVPPALPSCRWHCRSCHQCCRSFRWRCGSRFLAGTWDTAGRWRPIMRCRSPGKTKTCNNRTRTCNRGRAHSARTGYPYGAEGYHYGTERRRETTSRGYCIQRASWGMEVRYER